MPDETEQAAARTPEASTRADHITREAIDVFGDFHRATRWLEAPHEKLDDRAPLAVAVDSDEGMQQVFELLRHAR